MNDKKRIAIVSSLLTLIAIILIFNYIELYNSSKDNSDYITFENLKIYFYGDISDAYQNDGEVIKVYELCKDSEIKTVCVYENIDFVWSEAFESLREDYFFSPTEMVKYRSYGVCRDIAVFRMAVLKKLNIYAKFVFIPGHVYVKTFEGGKIYELDNGYMRVNYQPLK